MRRKISTSVANLARDISGNFAVMAAVIVPVLGTAVGGMLDYNVYRANIASIQNAADAAALAAAHEAILQGWTQKVASAVAENYVDASLTQAGLTKGEYTVNVDIDDEARRVTVTVNQTEFDYLLIGLVKLSPYITASATAQSITDANVCVVGLMEPTSRNGASSSIHLDNDSRIDSPDCGIYADHRTRYAFRMDSNAYVRANVVCSAGGFYFGRSNGEHKIDPEPRYDCPSRGDPLMARPKPAVGACDFTDFVARGPVTLEPGVYCGGIDIEGSFKADLKPGIYIVKDGPLRVGGNATIEGDNVGFFLTGRGSVFNFESDSRVRLTAPIDGLLAGILFFEDTDVPYSFDFDPFDLANLPVDVRLHTMSSNDARLLVGTFYLPRSLFLINADAPVADQSAYTAIVAGRLWLQEGPTLVLNADYAATTVPVPDGIGPQEKGVRLVE